MGETTAISWTDHTFNPWWGCTKIQAPDGERSACDHCYAEAFAKRTGNDVWGKESGRRFFGDKHWREPIKWNRAAEADGRRHRVFCASMADVFEDRADLAADRGRLFELIVGTPWLDWQLLTKRPERIPTLARGWVAGGWPVNAWVGTTVESQRAADLRVPRLLQVPAPVRFLSMEPLFEAVDVTPWLHDGIQWVIVGGESGPKFQALDLDHARSVRDQCVDSGVPFFFKQVGGRTPTAGGNRLDGMEWHQFPDEAVARARHETPA